MRGRLVAHRGGRSGFMIGVLILLAVLIGPMAYRADPIEFDFSNRLAGPSAAHPAGTDHLGRDTLARLLDGGRRSLFAGILALAGAVLIGLVIGVTAGFVGGVVDSALMRLIDVVLAVPSLVTSLAIIGILGVGPVTMVVAVAAGFWPVLARLARSMVVSLRTRPDVIAARMAGVPSWRIALGHVVPGVAIEMVVVASFNFAEVLGLIAGLSFLGLGVQPPDAEWGSMLNEARPFFNVAPWLIYGPIISLVLSVTAATLVGSALRDAADFRVRIGRRDRRPRAVDVRADPVAANVPENVR